MNTPLNNPVPDIEKEFALALQYHQSGQLQAAEEIYKKLLEIQPDHPDALHLLGVAAHQTGKNDTAEELINRAIQINPLNPNYYNNLGASFRARGKLKEAISCYEKTLQVSPDYAEAHNNMGNVFREMGRLNDAVSSYKKALELRPSMMGAYKNLGATLRNQGKLDEAIEYYKKALEIQPDHIGVYNNLGNAYRDQGRIQEAVTCYQRLLEIQPDPGIEVKKILAIPPIIESKEGIEQVRNQIIRELDALQKRGFRLDNPHQQVGTTNFYLAYHGLNDREIQQKIAEFYLRSCPDLAWKNPHLATDNGFGVSSDFGEICRTVEQKRTTNKHKIGFVSIHLCHPTQQTIGKLNRGIIKNLSRDKFHLILFRFAGRKHDMVKTFEPDEVVVLPEELHGARRKIAEHSPDILYYPDIGMDSMTYFLAFSRLAPVQCTTWGHPVTTGIPEMDYFISSETLEPPGAEDHYSERLARMKRLNVFYYRPKPPGEVPSREKFNLPEGYNLYVCPQAIFKFHPDFDAALGAILRHDSKGLIVLLEGSYAHFTTLWTDRFKRQFPDVAHQVRFVPFMSHRDFLSLLMLADVLIDPPYFGGGNTSYESFACGVPIVTWPGPFMRGRVTLALYQQMGVTDCVAHDGQSYIEIALRLANDKKWRDEIRSKISAHADIIFEDIETVRDLENFFETALEKATRNPQPAPPEPVSQPVIPQPAPPFDTEGEMKKAIQYHQSGESRKAEEIYRKILEINPNHADALHLSGVAAHQSGKKEIGAELIRKAIRNDPGKACYYNSLGITFQDQGKLDQAVASYHKALEINPNFVEAYGNIGFSLQDMGKQNEAIAFYQKALQVRPGDAVIHNDMGTALQDLGRVDEAAACYRKALEITPNYPEAYNNLGNACKDQKNLDESVLCYKKALELKPDYTKAYTCLIRQLQQTCAWQELGEYLPKLDALTKGELESRAKTSESPFMNLARSTDLAYNLTVAKSWSDDAARLMSGHNFNFSFDNRSSGHKKITVGYLSGDFRNHAVSHLMLGLFGLHNRDDFNIFCYSYGKDDRSDYRKRIMQDCDQFVDLSSTSHAESARRIYDDQVDILVELTGHTKDCRLGICAPHPAPIQVIYLGFPGTSGADFLDYIITDSIITPEAHSPYYTEKFAYMPHCFQVNDNTQPISDTAWTKSDFGLPGDSFVFCSFNHGYKIESVMFDVWMKILRQVPGSILWLPKKSETGEKNLRQEAGAGNVNPERLFFAERLPTKEEYLARIKLADLALDTRLYNGHTTTSDALWAGVPVITLQGNHYASRVASSVLTAVGLPELVTYTPEEYESLAVRLANAPDELRAIRMKLEKNRLTEPLFDTQKFTRNLEKVYKQMWEIFLSGEKPRHIC
ncbi:tetratricopeptide repeat protein [Desulfococcaceae bacterium HSG8]|nr:tetratricopeptide repeat protein [Desulfococcaceae bacterium HSG8]